MKLFTTQSPRKISIIHTEFKKAAQVLLVLSFLAFHHSALAYASEGPPPNLIPIEQAKANLVNQGVGTIESSQLVREGNVWAYYFNVRTPDQNVQQIRVNATTAANGTDDHAVSNTDRAPAHDHADFSRH
jgi:hypothetical protein